ncbi:hypothetical protein OJAV_G00114370 [Oryzias javanicus]|uniref:Uncharacterized protein n=1 Tax=Oryzias javanicus TaxID=123683 RepID=A0A3S2M3J3_ORYJA|nr:hypothetical protein OJAV_G00114370 [Oryzias javanicus]
MNEDEESQRFIKIRETGIDLLFHSGLLDSGLELLLGFGFSSFTSWLRLCALELLDRPQLSLVPKPGRQQPIEEDRGGKGPKACRAGPLRGPVN